MPLQICRNLSFPRSYCWLLPLPSSWTFLCEKLGWRCPQVQFPLLFAECIFWGNNIDSLSPGLPLALAIFFKETEFVTGWSNFFAASHSFPASFQHFLMLNLHFSTWTKSSVREQSKVSRPLDLKLNGEHLFRRPILVVCWWGIDKIVDHESWVAICMKMRIMHPLQK